MYAMRLFLSRSAPSMTPGAGGRKCRWLEGSRRPLPQAIELRACAPCRCQSADRLPDAEVDRDRVVGPGEVRLLDEGPAQRDGDGQQHHREDRDKGADGAFLRHVRLDVFWLREAAGDGVKGIVEWLAHGTAPA